MLKFSPNTTTHHQTLFKISLHMAQKNYVSSHLGILVDIQSSKIAHLNFLVDLMSKILLSCNSLLLSLSNKVILINTVLTAIISHIFSSFSIPIRVTNRLVSMTMSFLWSNRDKSSINYWVKK